MSFGGDLCCDYDRWIDQNDNLNHQCNLFIGPNTIDYTGNVCYDKDTEDHTKLDLQGDKCENYYGNQNWCGNHDTAEFDSNDLCCECGGGNTYHP